VSRETLSLTLYSWESTFTVRFDFYSAATQLNEHVRTQVLTPQCPHLFNTTTYEASNQVYCFTVAFQSVSLFIGYLALVCSVLRHLACTYEQSLLLLSYACASDAVSRHCCVLSRLCLEFPCLVLFFFSWLCLYQSQLLCAEKLIFLAESRPVYKLTCRLLTYCRFSETRAKISTASQSRLNLILSILARLVSWHLFLSKCICLSKCLGSISGTYVCL